MMRHWRSYASCSYTVYLCFPSGSTKFMNLITYSECEKLSFDIHRSKPFVLSLRYLSPLWRLAIPTQILLTWLMCCAKTDLISCGHAGFVGFRLFIGASSALEFMLGRFPALTCSAWPPLRCARLLKILMAMLFAKDCAVVWILACMKTSVICSLITVNLWDRSWNRPKLGCYWIV